METKIPFRGGSREYPLKCEGGRGPMKPDRDVKGGKGNPREEGAAGEEEAEKAEEKTNNTINNSTKGGSPQGHAATFMGTTRDKREGCPKGFRRR